MRSIARFRAVILWACSRFFPSAPGFNAVSLDGSSFFLLFLSVYYNYVLLFTSWRLLHFHFSFFLFLFLFIFSGFYMARRAIDLYMGWFAGTKRTMDTVDLGAARMEMRQA